MHDISDGFFLAHTAKGVMHFILIAFAVKKVHMNFSISGKAILFEKPLMAL